MQGDALLVHRCSVHHEINQTVYRAQLLACSSVCPPHHSDCSVFPNSVRECLRKYTGGTESQCAEGSLHPPLPLSMPLQRSAGRSAWIVIVAANRIQERPDDATWGPGRVELNGCQALKAHAACEQTHKGWTRPLRGPSYRLSPLHGGRLKIK